MKFQLVQHSTTRANTVFHVRDAGDGTVLGSINCPRGQEDDLLGHWRGAQQSPGTPAGPAAAARPGVKLRLPPLSKQAILRGS